MNCNISRRSAVKGRETRPNQTKRVKMERLKNQQRMMMMMPWKVTMLMKTELMMRFRTSALKIWIQIQIWNSKMILPLMVMIQIVMKVWKKSQTKFFVIFFQIIFRSLDKCWFGVMLSTLVKEHQARQGQIPVFFYSYLSSLMHLVLPCVIEIC